MEKKDLTPEIKEKLKACESPEDVFALAKEMGRQLTEEEVEMISGGSFKWDCDPGLMYYI